MRLECICLGHALDMFATSNVQYLQKNQKSTLRAIKPVLP